MGCLALLRHELAAVQQFINLSEAHVHILRILTQLLLALLVENLTNVHQFAFHLAQDHLHLGLGLANRSTGLDHAVLRLAVSHAEAAFIVVGLPRLPPRPLNTALLPQLVSRGHRVELAEVFVGHSFLLFCNLDVITETFYFLVFWLLYILSDKHTATHICFLLS